MADNMRQGKLDTASHAAQARTNGGQFKKGSRRASEAGKKGAAAQSTNAKRLGGQNSHRSM